MTFNRYARTPALSTLLRGWDDAGRKQQTRMPLQAAVEVAAPSADMAAWIIDQTDARSIDTADRQRVARRAGCRAGCVPGKLRRQLATHD
jgi:hypothetical protein